MNNKQGTKELWDIYSLMDHYPKLFPTIGSVRHMIRNRMVPIVRFTPKGKIFFCSEEIENWIMNHKINEFKNNKYI